MTADAKVGLLLGLFFIVVIAFLVNGLPNFIHEENPSTPGAAIMKPTGPDIPLDNRVSDAVHRLYPSRVQSQTTEPAPIEVILQTPPTAPAHVEIADISPPAQEPVVINNDSTTVTPAVVKSAVRTHVVKSGESLAVIAQTYYGKDQGNRLAVIQKLYEANSSVLKAPDRICVGDKLVVPQLDELLAGKKAIVRAPDASQTLLNMFPNMLKRTGNDDTKSVSEYEVQEGENLWSIAKRQLGDGNRFKEIVSLNKIKDADEVVAGVRLKMPPQ